MKKTSGIVQLELRDVIRVNALIRGRTDVAGAVSWYNEVSHEGQEALVNAFVFFGYQAGVSKDNWNAAISATEIESDKRHIIDRAKKDLSMPHGMGVERFNNWFAALGPSDRLAIFTLALHLFAASEGKVFRNETKESCNHRWHRDLLDERVVDDLLTDPEFYMTSMEDDDNTKGGKGSWRRRLSRRLKKTWSSINHQS